MKKIVTIVGARPQFIKAAAVSRAIGQRDAGDICEVMVHTGQHFDDNMSAIFFEELEVSSPRYNLEISGGSHGAMTGLMLRAIEEVLFREKPDWLLIYGDTNSTLAGALAAVKMHIPIAHVEAGLRSYNMHMPEEINRILSDRVSSLLLCPTDAAIQNLKREGIESGVHKVGDVMYDVALHQGARAREKSGILNKLGLSAGEYVLATCHRAENTDNKVRLESILKALNGLGRDRPVILPLHPRTRQIISACGLHEQMHNVTVIEPASYLDMVALEQSAAVICTDSGGVQKEAFFFGVPCVTMRDETEWVELVEAGWNSLVGADAEHIEKAARQARKGRENKALYGDGNAADRIVELMMRS